MLCKRGGGDLLECLYELTPATGSALTLKPARGTATPIRRCDIMQNTSDTRRRNKPPRPHEELDPYTLERVRADRLRPVAYRQGLVLVKSRLKKHRGQGNSAYHLVALPDLPMAKKSPILTLSEVEVLLDSGQLARPQEVEWRTHKTCTACGKTKPLEEFYQQKRALDGHQTICKDCSSLRYATYYAENKTLVNERSKRNMQKKRDEDKDYNARHSLWGKFGLTLEEYDARLAAQGGVCVICGKPPGKKRLHVDHDRDCCPGDRTCGKCVRDLLCSGCNNGTGITDNAFLLRRKADYLELWRFRHAEQATQAA